MFDDLLAFVAPYSNWITLLWGALLAGKTVRAVLVALFVISLWTLDRWQTWRLSVATRRGEALIRAEERERKKIQQLAIAVADFMSNPGAQTSSSIEHEMRTSEFAPDAHEDPVVLKARRVP